MFREQDPYSYTQSLPIYTFSTPPGTPSPQQIGFISLDYQVSLYNDVQVLTEDSVTQPQNQQFIVNCTQCIILTNDNNTSWDPRLVQVSESINPFDPPTFTPVSFKNYPVLFTASVAITPENGLTVELLDYSPHTVNTAVEESMSTGSETTTSTTTGTSFSASSNYGASVGLSDERTRTRESSHNASASMSIKDWGSYASVNLAEMYPTWVFGQEFPWNAITCRFLVPHITYLPHPVKTG